MKWRDNTTITTTRRTVWTSVSDAASWNKQIYLMLQLLNKSSLIASVTQILWDDIRPRILSYLLSHNAAAVLIINRDAMSGLNMLLHCALASCGTVYCNRSCLWVCVFAPYYSQHVHSVCVSLRAFFILHWESWYWFLHLSLGHMTSCLGLVLLSWFWSCSSGCLGHHSKTI